MHFNAFFNASNIFFIFTCIVVLEPIGLWWIMGIRGTPATKHHSVSDMVLIVDPLNVL